MMAEYQQPKTDWQGGDNPGDDDFNRIEGNTKANRSEVNHIKSGDTLVTANNVGLKADDSLMKEDLRVNLSPQETRTIVETNNSTRLLSSIIMSGTDLVYFNFYIDGVAFDNINLLEFYSSGEPSYGVLPSIFSQNSLRIEVRNNSTTDNAIIRGKILRVE